MFARTMVAVGWLLAGGHWLLAETPAQRVSQGELRSAIEKSLPLLMQGAIGHRENRTCFACHNQGLPILALMAADQRGFVIDREEIDRQTAFIAKFLDGNRENYLQGKGQGGQADTAGYALWTLAEAGHQADDITAAVSEYLILRNKDKDHWQNNSNRPPSEANPFTTSYVALYGLAFFGTTERQERIAVRMKQVREWLAKTPAKDNEERVFRLLGLKAASVKAAGSADDEIAAAAKELLVKQRDDGGWAQLDSGEPEAATKSDAYATGSALVALHEAGRIAAADDAYQRGVRYLLKTQLDDGSWHVKSRSKPFQPYYESGFPHGKDQFISCAASSWATWALVVAIDAQ
jgi:squalene-hopene cyclase-like protein